MLTCPHCEHELTPHEIGVLYAAVGRTRNNTSRRFWGAKLTTQDVNRIRKSKKPIWKIAEQYNVSFVTIWRVKENMTHNSPGELKCPHCGQELNPQEIGRLFAALGGSTYSPLKAKTSAANGRNGAKLTDKDVADIRKSNASVYELAKKHKVHFNTIIRARKKERQNAIPSE